MSLGVRRGSCVKLSAVSDECLLTRCSLRRSTRETIRSCLTAWEKSLACMRSNCAVNSNHTAACFNSTAGDSEK